MFLVSIPILLDGIDNDVLYKYQSWPDRLHVISPDRKISYQGCIGPLYFDVGEFEQELNKTLTA
jgi:hypothetical protein